MSTVGFLWLFVDVIKERVWILEGKGVAFVRDSDRDKGNCRGAKCNWEVE